MQAISRAVTSSAQLSGSTESIPVSPAPLPNCTWPSCENTPPKPPVTRSTLYAISEHASMQIDTYISNIESGKSYDVLLGEASALAVSLYREILSLWWDIENHKKWLSEYIEDQKIGRSDTVGSLLDRLVFYISVMQVTSIETWDARSQTIDHDISSNVSPGNTHQEIQRNTESTETNGIRYVSAERSVTMRTTPNVYALNVYKYLPRNSQVKLLETRGGWSYVEYEGGRWFVKTAFLREQMTTDLIREWVVPLSAWQKAVVIADHSLNVRNAPDVHSRIRAILYRWDMVIVGERIGKWVEIFTDSYSGYVSARYISESLTR
jgi:SH3-like domain-containing protein